MKKFLTYDLETSFLKTGQKRTNQRMLEIALYCKEFSFSKLINPCDQYKSGQEVIESLHKMDQNPEKTLRFWTKLLVEKRHLKSHFKRAGQQKQADAISTLLQRSAKALDNKGEYTSNQWLYALENNKDDVKLAKKYLDEYEVEEKSNSPLFYDTKSTLEEALNIGIGRTWVAHNGRSFDSKIVRGNCDRLGIKINVDFEDSLPMFRRTITSDSYSQPLLYRGIFGKGYKAHHALDDCIALYELLEYVSDKENVTIEKLFEVKKAPIKKYSDLLEISGIGVKSLEKFKKGGIHCKKDLYKWVQEHSHDEFLKQFRGVYRYKSFAEKLYPI